MLIASVSLVLSSWWGVLRFAFTIVRWILIHCSLRPRLILDTRTDKNDLSENRESILTEISILKNVSHPNIINLYDTERARC